MLTRRLAAVVALWTAYLTAYPLEGIALAEVGERLRAGLSDPSVERPLLHIVSLGSFGALLGLGSRGAPRRAEYAAILGFVVGLEVLQGFAPTRHPRGGDLLLDAAAAGVAYALAGALDRRLHPSRWIREHQGVLARALAACAALFLGASILLHERDVSFTGWDAAHGFAVGNELTWNRPWEGEVYGLALYAQALDDEAIGRLARADFGASGVALRRRHDPVALYDFAVRDGAIPDRSALAPPLALGVAAASTAGSGIGIDTQSRVAASRAPKLHRALTDGSALTVEVVCRSADPSRGGPARIVSFSADPHARNFTVGQERDALVFRVRTPPNGPNGLETEAAWPGVFVGADAHHLALTYARGLARAFVDGVERAPGVWRLDWPSPRVAHVPVGRPLLAAALLCLPLGALAGLGWARARLRVRLGLGALASGGVATAATLIGVTVFRTPWDPTLPLLAAVSAPLFDALLSLPDRVRRRLA